MVALADRTWSGYSLAEWDRRWKAVRGHAAKAGLDCVFVPLGNALDAQYLTDLPIEKGNAWIWKPTAVSADGKIRFGMGGDVVITDQGGERLFTRPQGMGSIT